MPFKKGHKGFRKNYLNIIAWNKGKSKKEFPLLSNSGVKKGNIPWNKNIKYLCPKRKTGKIVKCYTCNKEIYRPKCKLGKNNRYYCSKKCQSLSPYKKEISSKWMKFLNKDKNIIIKRIKTRKLNDKLLNRKPYNYIDGSSNERYSNFKEWIKIAKKCYKRDNYTCQHCGKKGGLIHAHHIIPFSISKNNNLKNLITLCPKCHNKEHRRLRNETKN